MASTEDKPTENVHSKNVAIIFGVTGLVGRELAKNLTSQPNWKVYGVSRRPESIPIQNPNYHFISCDLLNPLETQKSLQSLNDVSHVFWVTWSGQFRLDTKECLEQNRAMLENAMNALLLRAKSLKHVSLQTGMKHYISLTGSFRKEPILYSEEFPRINGGFNFYYALEDLLKEKLTGKVSWSVLRPGLLMGSSNRTLYNVIGSLCVYGSICKHLNLPFVFRGSRQCWEEVCIDGSDSWLVAEQHIWAATEIESADGQAFNAINGPSFTWKEVWTDLGKKLGAEVPEKMLREELCFAVEMREKKKVWEEIVEKKGLVKTSMKDLANWEFMDMLFRSPVKLLGSREKSDRFGFTARCETRESVLYWIDSMREDNLIP